MSKRAITVDGVRYEYTIGRGAVRITDVDGKSVAVDLTDATGRTWDVIERGQRKKTSDGMVTPSDIERTIRTLRETT